MQRHDSRLPAPIGILGGTFDPIHLGHLNLVTKIYQVCRLHSVSLLPSYQSPLKKTPLASSQNRLNMARLVADKFPFLSVDEYEIRQPSITYTITTLEYLRKKYGNRPLAFIVGSDLLNDFDKWHRWQEILQLAHLIIVTRPGWEQLLCDKIKVLGANKQIFKPQELQKKVAGSVYNASIEPMAISATAIREMIKNGKDVSSFLTREVWQYISDNRLYELMNRL